MSRDFGGVDRDRARNGGVADSFIHFHRSLLSTYKVSGVCYVPRMPQSAGRAQCMAHSGTQ